MLADAGSALKSFDAALKGVDGTKVARTIDNIDKFATALGDNSGNVDEIVRNATELSAKLNKSADQVDKVLASAQKFLGSPETQGALDSVTDMAKSIRVLADNLDKRTADITTGVSRLTGLAFEISRLWPRTAGAHSVNSAALFAAWNAIPSSCFSATSRRSLSILDVPERRKSQPSPVKPVPTPAILTQDDRRLSFVILV